MQDTAFQEPLSLWCGDGRAGFFYLSEREKLKYRSIPKEREKQREKEGTGRKEGRKNPFVCFLDLTLDREDMIIQ